MSISPKPIALVDDTNYVPGALEPQPYYVVVDKSPVLEDILDRLDALENQTSALSGILGRLDALEDQTSVLDGILDRLDALENPEPAAG